MALTSVITEIGKRRMAELQAGLISGPFSPGSSNQSVRPVFFQIGTGGQVGGNQKSPDPKKTDLEAPAIGGRIQKALIGPVALGNDINVSLPPFSAEATIEFMLVLTAGENTLGAGITVAEVGVFVQFGTNPPELFVYGTFKPFLSDGTLAVDFRLNPKI